MAKKKVIPSENLLAETFVKPQPRRSRRSKSKKAGIDFPVTKFIKKLKIRSSRRVGATAGVYLAVSIEYLVAEILELASEVAISEKRLRIKPRDILLAVRADQELGDLVRTVVLPDAGVIPNIHANLLPKKKKGLSASMII